MIFFVHSAVPIPTLPSLHAAHCGFRLRILCRKRREMKKINMKFRTNDRIKMGIFSPARSLSPFSPLATRHTKTFYGAHNHKHKFRICWFVFIRLSIFCVRCCGFMLADQTRLIVLWQRVWAFSILRFKSYRMFFFYSLLVTECDVMNFHGHFFENRVVRRIWFDFCAVSTLHAPLNINVNR